MLSAATVTNNATRNAMIAQVHGYASSNNNNTVFGGYYNPVQGSVVIESGTFSGHGDNSYVQIHFILLKACDTDCYRPTVGSIFAFLLEGYV